MSKVKLGILIIVVCLIAYFVSLYYKVMSFINTYTYGYKLTGFKSNLLNTKGGNVTASFSFIISVFNPSSFKVTVSDLVVKLYYQNNYLGVSKNFSTIYIPKEGGTSFTGNADLLVNRALYNSIISFGSGKVVIDYIATFKLYGLPFKFTYRDKRTLNLSEYI